MAKPEIITIVICYTNDLYMGGYSKMLESGPYSVIGRVKDENSLLRCLSVAKPDILLYDLYVSLDHFEKSFKKISKVSPKTKVIVLGEDYLELANFCLNCGASGFFDEDLLDIDLLVGTISRIHGGEVLFLSNKNRLAKAKRQI